MSITPDNTSNHTPVEPVSNGMNMIQESTPKENHDVDFMTHAESSTNNHGEDTERLGPALTAHRPTQTPSHRKGCDMYVV